MNDLTVIGSIVGYLIVVNMWSAALVWWDKRHGRLDRRRIRERTLYLSAFLGGFFGGVWAMRGLRHKTVKNAFIWRYAVAVVAHLSIWGVVIRLAL
jgi:uncharacterized membrane protein YsdA (DUF1294 family)